MRRGGSNGCCLAPHLHNQLAWLRTFVDSYHGRESQLVATGINIENLTKEKRTARIREARGRAQGHFGRQAYPLEILHEDDLIFKLSDINNRVNLAPLPGRLMIPTHAGEDEPPEERSCKITMVFAEYIAKLTIKEVGDIPLKTPPSYNV
ncbi:hypothetical protein PG995_007830 [Apiospora arundinis]